MRAGALDRRIKIEAHSEVQDEFGGLTTVWLPFVTVWARVAPVTGKETFLSDQVTASADTLFRIRYLIGLDTKMRIVYDGKNYNIKNIIEIGRREGFNILAVNIEAERDS